MKDAQEKEGMPNGQLKGVVEKTKIP